jgi:tRNA ligase
MKHHTEPPYYLTLKSNGCLILISALSPAHLLVASKHALGTTTNQTYNTSAVEDSLSTLSLESAQPNNSKASEQENEGPSADRAHAEVGRQWVRHSLAQIGKSEAQLAERLWTMNCTAVLEVSRNPYDETTSNPTVV